MKTSNASIKLSELKNHLKRLEIMMRNGVQKSDQRFKALVSKISKLIQELRKVYSTRQLRRVLGSFALVFGSVFYNHSTAQSFAPPVVNAFGLQTDGNFIFPEFADLDDDGDQDMLARQGYGSYVYYENTGSVTSPDFSSTPIMNPFGLSQGDPLGFPTIADFDNDGDLDIMQGSYYGVFRYFENTGSASLPEFAPFIENPFGLEPTFYYAFVDAADLDDDGDLDLLSGEYYGNLKYFENIGNSTSPAFAPQVLNPYGLNIVTMLAFPEIVDLDNDGDLDVLVGEYYGNFKYFQNTGSASNPSFGTPIQNPFGLGQSYEIGYPASVDLDDDGDMDLMVTDYYGEYTYYENLINSNNLDELSSKIGVFPNPAMDEIHINSEQEITNIRIVDVSGKIVHETPQFSETINVSSFDNGSYIVELFLSNGFVVKKQFVKQ